ncbi:MAG: amidohydrolase family protein [Deltaproteobacteria bacterium]|nr:amidohydrolase family protein [Deltaproteobacteria bacterium]
MTSTRPHPISWMKTGQRDHTQLRIAYRGPLSGRDLRLHYGFDGWQEPVNEIKLEQLEPGLAVTEPLALAGHISLECVVTNGERWDNNQKADYRLWLDFEPLDAHMHVSGRGSGELGIASLRTAMASAGITHGIVSWVENRALDRLKSLATGLFPLVWVRPGETTRDEVRTRLCDGFIGLKLHPTVDDYRADDSELDPYLELAAEAGCPVACHSAPGDADPDHIRRLAERFPSVPVILYHTYLGPEEGRRRAAQHVREQQNLYLETSWCRWREVLQLVEETQAERVIFGSDASVDGPHHYCRHPPNVQGQETYNEGLVPLVRALGPAAARNVLGDNARRLFGLNGNSHG